MPQKIIKMATRRLSHHLPSHYKAVRENLRPFSFVALGVETKELRRLKLFTWQCGMPP